ncbi:MAG: matrixin family metalloprotease, partial [Marmoricola sp.]
PSNFRSLHLAAALFVACVIGIGSVPAAVASTAPATTQTSTALAASGDHDVVSLDGDSPHTSSSARRASYAWTGSRVYYYSTVAEKWNWSLRTAVNKWNHSGGGIRFVRTTSRSKAQVRISSADTGTAAGMATVGRVHHAYVHLSRAYANVDELDAHYRIEVMMIFAHELGHVLGFHHSSVACSLMAPMLDVEGCNVIPRAEKPGYYRCRTISGPLAARFVRIYGGKAKFPDSWCPIDTIPSALTSVDITGGTDAPVTISWASPASVLAGSSVKINTWQSDSCDAVPDTAAATYAPVTAGAWEDPQSEYVGTICFGVQLVNRYGAGQPAVARLLGS